METVSSLHSFQTAFWGVERGGKPEFILNFQEDTDGMTNWSFQSKAQILIFSYGKWETLLKVIILSLIRKEEETSPRCFLEDGITHVISSLLGALSPYFSYSHKVTVRAENDICF